MDGRDYRDSQDLGQCMRVGDVDCSRAILRDVMQDRDALQIIRNANAISGPRGMEHVSVDDYSGRVMLEDRRFRPMVVGQIEPAYQPPPPVVYDRRAPYYEPGYPGTPPYVGPRNNTGETVAALALGALALGALASRNNHRHDYYHHGRRY